MTEDDDSLWFETLAGRGSANGSHPAAIEARALRTAILSQPRDIAVSVPLQDPRREASLLERARREGLLVDSLDLGPATRHLRASSPLRGHYATGRALRNRTRVRYGLAAVAAVVFVGTAFVTLVRPPPHAPTLRGSSGGIVRLETSDPRSLQRELLSELNSAGVSATPYERLGGRGVDADLPQPVPENVRAILARHHIKTPADGVLRVEIVESRGP